MAKISEPLNWYSAVKRIEKDNQPFTRPESIDIGVTRLQCSVCNGDRFHIGSADYETVVRCLCCQNETSIHQG